MVVAFWALALALANNSNSETLSALNPTTELRVSSLGVKGLEFHVDTLDGLSSSTASKAGRFVLAFKSLSSSLLRRP